MPGVKCVSLVLGERVRGETLEVVCVKGHGCISMAKDAGLTKCSHISEEHLLMTQ